MDLTTKCPLKMAHRHSAEWNGLLSAQLMRIKNLYLNHKIEKKTFAAYTKKYIYVADRIKKQTLEIKELECLNQEERIILKEKHFREEHPFT